MDSISNSKSICAGPRDSDAVVLVHCPPGSGQEVEGNTLSSCYCLVALMVTANQPWGPLVSKYRLCGGLIYNSLGIRNFMSK
ncbi:hypothetical protein Pmani_011050 [Petrolisthes manimaculis]|uniref:Uncharacterized protein n=1 Tax=Petrolisthes manimaculis TaxID=1843537 RepID=A0AAE1UBG0_9EUCA|nr:hypothetical protein Pmani_011050 [Petrolisthes manimaculis]